MLISVGTTAAPARDACAIRSSVSPVPCSIESMPAAIRPGSASSPKTCAATRTPSSCARPTAAARTSSGHTGARSPIERSIQSAAIFTQPSPRAACASTSCDEVRRFDLDTEIADVAMWPGDVASRRGSTAAGPRVAAPNGCRPASRRRAATGHRRRGRALPASPGRRRRGRNPAERVRRGSAHPRSPVRPIPSPTVSASPLGAVNVSRPSRIQASRSRLVGQEDAADVQCSHGRTGPRLGQLRAGVGRAAAAARGCARRPG